MIKLYKSYLFRDKSPIIYAIRDLREKCGMTPLQVAENGGPSTTSQWNWDYGTTQRPQEASTTAAIRAMGYNIAIVDGKNKIVYALNPNEYRHRLQRKRKPKKNGNT